jgi:hypothetical protein
MVIALVLMAALFGCGDSGEPGRGSATRGGDAGDGPGHRQKANFALAKMACGEVPKADFAVDSVGIPAGSSDPAIARGYVADWPPNDRKGAFAGCLKGLEKVPDRFPRSSPSARNIWGRNFLVVSVTSNRKGEDPPVVKPYRFRFWFSSEMDHAMSWKARCNSTGADAHFTARRIETEMTLTTLIGCPMGPGREDAWMDRFMASNPEWRLAGESLHLSSDGATIELRGFRNPNKYLIPPSGWIDSGTSKFDCESALDFVTLYVEGRDTYYPGWDCRDTELARGRLNVSCRDGEEWFASHGFDPAFYQRRLR